MAVKTVDLCSQAAELNYTEKMRQGNIINLPEKGRLIITGDLHGHTKNFKRILAFADLENNPDTYLIFQEILHGGDQDPNGGCLSFLLFFKILEFKLKYPKQVHIMMGNHDTAIVTDSDVIKGGKEMNDALKNSLKECYEGDFYDVYEAIKEFLLSEPLAVRTSSGIWMSHSLPADQFISDFDHDVFDRDLFPDDLLRGEPAYYLTWGRKHSQEKINEFADALGVKTFIVGHQVQEKGFLKAGENIIILSSEHNHGCLMAFDLEKDYTTDELVECIVPIASIDANG